MPFIVAISQRRHGDDCGHSNNRPQQQQRHDEPRSARKLSIRIGCKKGYILVRIRNDVRIRKGKRPAGARPLVGIDLRTGRSRNYLRGYGMREQKPPIPLTVSAHCCIEEKQFVPPMLYCAQYRAAIAEAADAATKRAVERAIMVLVSIVGSPVHDERVWLTCN
jgi:hypothetical protein